MVQSSVTIPDAPTKTSQIIGDLRVRSHNQGQLKIGKILVNREFEIEIPRYSLRSLVRLGTIRLYDKLNYINV